LHLQNLLRPTWLGKERQSPLLGGKIRIYLEDRVKQLSLEYFF
jgi:hypothetical protein